MEMYSDDRCPQLNDASQSYACIALTTTPLEYLEYVDLGRERTNPSARSLFPISQTLDKAKDLAWRALAK